MKKPAFLKFPNKIKLLIAIILVANILISCEKTDTLDKPNEAISPYTLVSHAGGAIYGYRYTNSLEAIEESYKNGFKLIEIDFQWTSDDKVVAMHDWFDMVERLFMIESRVLSLEEFKSLDTFHDLTLMDLENIAKWVKTKKDVFIVTDMKRDNLRFLKLLAENHQDIKKQIIPQIYHIEEYLPVKEMGYNNIILTLYESNYTDDEIIKFIEGNKVFAITMSIERGYTKLPGLLKEKGIRTYIHTVNNLCMFEELYKNGITGMYTDYFHANKFDPMLIK